MSWIILCGDKNSNFEGCCGDKYGKDIFASRKDAYVFTDEKMANVVKKSIEKRFEANEVWALVKEVKEGEKE